MSTPHGGHGRERLRTERNAVKVLELFPQPPPNPGWIRLRRQLEQANGDQLREMGRTTAQGLLSAAVDRVYGAAYGVVPEARVNSRNGYWMRGWDTRVGTIEFAIPKLRKGSYFPGWLLEPRRGAERALVPVIADCCLAGVSTRRVDKLVKQLGLDGISQSRVSELAKTPDEVVESS